MSVRHLFNPSSLARRQFMVPPITPRSLPPFPATNSLLSRSYAAFTDRPPRNEEIKLLCHEIKFIDAAGKYQGLNSLESVLSMMDRETYDLVCVNPHIAPEPVICKLISKQQIEEDERAAYLARKMKNRNNKNPSKTVKTVEISWATAPNDLGHKLRRVNEFLLKGNRVEVVLGVKKGMAKQPLGKMVEMVQQIKNESAESGIEWKSAEGKVGVQYMIYLEGHLPKKVEEPKLLEGARATKRSKTRGVAEGLKAGVEVGVAEEMDTVGRNEID